MSIVTRLHINFRKTVIITVITADTQCRMLSPSLITTATILEHGAVYEQQQGLQQVGDRRHPQAVAGALDCWSPPALHAACWPPRD